MQKEKNQNKSKKIIQATLIAAVLFNSWTPNARAVVTAQDATIKIGLSIAGAIAGKEVTKFLYPSKGIDYEKIRKMMEEVTKKVVIDSEVSLAEGLLKGRNSYVRAAIYAKGVSPIDRYNKLYDLSLEITGFIDRISGEFFARESLSTYVVGAQTELAVIAAMYFFAKEAEDGGKMSIAEVLFDERLSTHYEQLSYLKIVQDELIERRYMRVSCKQYGDYFKGFKWWLQDNDWDGRQLVRNWYKSQASCNWVKVYQYEDVVLRQFVVSLNENEKFGWIHKIEQIWYDLGIQRGILISSDSLKPVKTKYITGEYNKW